jgi:hypothetical protein
MKTKKKTKETITNVSADQAVIQAKYENCVHILESVHNAIVLAMSLSTEFDEQQPLEIVQYALDQYKVFDKLSDSEIEALRKDTEELVQQIQVAFPDMEVKTSVPDSKPTKKELLN